MKLNFFAFVFSLQSKKEKKRMKIETVFLTKKIIYLYLEQNKKIEFFFDNKKISKNKKITNFQSSNMIQFRFV